MQQHMIVRSESGLNLQKKKKKANQSQTWLTFGRETNISILILRGKKRECGHQVSSSSQGSLYFPWYKPAKVVC